MRQRAEPTDIKFEDEVRGGAVMKWIERWRPEMEEDAALEQYAKKRMRIHATLSAERDWGVPVMDVKAVGGRSVGRCP